jgi:hypothetical protein
MISAAAVTLFLHVLPPFRPLTRRVERAQAISIIELTSINKSSVTFRTIAGLSGPILTQAKLLPGHRPSSKARYGLATFRQRRGEWVLQEQTREWIELEASDWTMHPPLVWKAWINRLKAKPQKTLLRSLDRPPFDRYAARDLNALMLDPKQSKLRSKVAFRLSKKRLGRKIAESLKHNLRQVTPATERSQIKRCLLGDASCLGR